MALGTRFFARGKEWPIYNQMEMVDLWTPINLAGRRPQKDLSFGSIRMILRNEVPEEVFSRLFSLNGEL